MVPGAIRPGDRLRELRGGLATIPGLGSTKTTRAARRSKEVYWLNTFDDDAASAVTTPEACVAADVASHSSESGDVRGRAKDAA